MILGLGCKEFVGDVDKRIDYFVVITCRTCGSVCYYRILGLGMESQEQCLDVSIESIFYVVGSVVCVLLLVELFSVIFVEREVERGKDANI